MKKLLLLLIPFVLLAPFVLFANVNLIEKGNALYEQGQFAEAQDLYKTAIDSGFVSSETYYNLGNAYFKNNNNPLAILAYERAHFLNPRDSEITRNLEYAKLFSPDKINSMFDNTFVGSFWQATRYFSYNEVKLTIIILFSLVTIFLFFYLITINNSKKTKALRRLAILFGVLAILTISLYITKLNDKWMLSSAIVLKAETDVSSSPIKGGELLFTLNPGTKVVILEQYENHLRISIEDGRQGWLQQTSIEKILP